MNYSEHISEYIKNYRLNKDLSLDDLSKKSGVSKSMIYQIELGKVAPTLTVMSKLADSMDVRLGELVDPTYKREIVKLTKSSESRQKKSKDGSFVCTFVNEGCRSRQLEIFQFEFSKKGESPSKGHSNKSVEFIILEKGEMELEVSGQIMTLKKGDIIEFDADKKHTYRQLNNKFASGVNIIFHQL